MLSLLNIDFFRHLSLLLQPNLLIPDVRIERLEELPGILSKLCVDHLVFDLDQTLVPYGEANAPDSIREIVRKTEIEYRCCILSNVPDSEEKRARLKRVAGQFGLAAITSPYKKPSPFAFQAALDFLEANAASTAMIGDRLFTDIIGAKHLGMKTVLVRPLNWRTDPLLMVTLPRLLESCLFLIVVFLRRFRDG